MNLKKFIKNETIFIIILIASLVSCFFVLPDTKYQQYLDVKVLAILFCLMAVVQGLGRQRLFMRGAVWLSQKAKSTRKLALLLTGFTFFLSMLITNDVALLTMVPFTLTLLQLCGQKQGIIYIVVLETVAANLGSMLTPIGNPQNLYLYSFYNFTPSSFLALTVPVVLLSGFLLLLFILPIKPKPIMAPHALQKEKASGRKIALFSLLFLLSLLAVFNIIHYMLAVVAIGLAVLIVDRAVYKKIDYPLLLTFVCFFVLVGNLQRIPFVQQLAQSLLLGREMASSILISQFISNVPAAVMLSAFTQRGDLLVLGTNIGGLGTMVASLASLISYKIYAKSENAKTGRYLVVFSAVNVVFLIILYLFAQWRYRL